MVGGGRRSPLIVVVDDEAWPVEGVAELPLSSASSSFLTGLVLHLRSSVGPTDHSKTRHGTM